MIFLNSLETEIELINNSLKSQKNLKLIILKYMQNYIEKPEAKDFGYANSALKLLEEVQKYINICNENILNLENTLTKLKKFKLEENNPNFILDDELNKYSETYSNVSKKISENTLIIEEYIHYIAENSTFMLSSKYESLDINNIATQTLKVFSNDITANKPLEEFSNNISNNPLEEIFNIAENKPLDEISNSAENKSLEEISNSAENKSLEEISNSIENKPLQESNITLANESLAENTLIISEKNGNVTLPFSINELNSIMQNKPSKYSSLNDIVNSKFTIPISRYKNAPVARFKEAFKLMRKKEHSSFLEAVDLGMELAFNYNLHPAIISACKSLDELDIYLDYLDTGDTDKFNCFKVIFELAPMITKKRNNAF